MNEVVGDEPNEGPQDEQSGHESSTSTIPPPPRLGAKPSHHQHRPNHWQGM